LAALGGLCDLRFLVTLGHCRNLAGLVLVETMVLALSDCCHLRSLAIVRGFVLIPAGDSQSVTILKSIKVWRGPQ
jgi:hypothetical protein